MENNATAVQNLVALADVKAAINNAADPFYDHEETDFTIDEVLDSIWRELGKVKTQPA